MIECSHEWEALQEVSRITNPAKVNIGCKWCSSQTWELETKWIEYKSRPTLDNRVERLENKLDELINIITNSAKKEVKPKTKKEKKA